MGLFDHWPYTNFHELNLDKILKFVKSVKDKTDAVDDAVQEAQQAANTATEAANLVIGTMVYVTPEMFGAKGDGVTDDTVAIRRATAVSEHLKGNVSKSYFITETIDISHDIFIEQMNMIIDPAEPDSDENIAFRCSNHNMIIENCSFSSTLTKIPRINYSNNKMYGLASNAIAASVRNGKLNIRNCYLSAVSGVFATQSDVYMQNIVGKDICIGLYIDGADSSFNMQNVDFEMTGKTADVYYHFLYARDHGNGKIDNCRCALSGNYESNESVKWGNEIHPYHTNSEYQNGDEAKEIIISNSVIDLRNANDIEVNLGQYSTARATFKNCEIYAVGTGAVNYSLTTGIKAPWFFDCKIVQTKEVNNPFFSSSGTIPTGYVGDFVRGRMTRCEVTLNNPSQGNNNVLVSLLSTNKNSVCIENCVITTYGFVFYGGDTSFIAHDCTIIFMKKVLLYLGSTRSMTFDKCTIIAQGDIDGTETTAGFSYAKLMNCSIIGLTKAKANANNVYGTAVFVSNDSATIENFSNFPNA